MPTIVKAMQHEEYEEILAGLLKKVPPEFAALLEEWAYDRGHSAGREEVLSILKDLVTGISPVIEEYTARVLGET